MKKKELQAALDAALDVYEQMVDEREHLLRAVRDAELWASVFARMQGRKRFKVPSKYIRNAPDFAVQVTPKKDHAIVEVVGK